MGLYGRDYMVPERGRAAPRPPLSVNARIIVANVVLWFVFAGSLSWGGPGGLFAFFYDYLALHPEDVIGKGRIWQLFTAFWLHDPHGLGHVFFNMLFLYFFGRHTEVLLGRRRYFQLYVLAGLASTLTLLPYAAIVGGKHVALGASGAVYGVGVLLALREPHLPVIFIIVRMPIWVLVGVFMVGREIVNLIVLQQAVGSTLGHLAGAAVGWAWYHFAPSAAAPRGPGGGLLARWRARRAARTQQRLAEEEGAVQARVDALLEKISREGIGALSAKEKDFLERASRRYGGRR